MIGRVTKLLAIALVLLVFGACNSTPAEPVSTVAASPTTASAYTPVVSLNEIMVYVVDTHSNELWDAAMAPPSTDEGWKQLQRAAVAIATAGSLTKLSGSGPKDQQWTQQADWSTHSQALSDAGLAAVHAVRDRNVQAIAQAGDQVVLTCINCHREYRLDVPTIWTERQLPPEETTRP